MSCGKGMVCYGSLVECALPEGHEGLHRAVVPPRLGEVGPQTVAWAVDDALYVCLLDGESKRYARIVQAESVTQAAERFAQDSGSLVERAMPKHSSGLPDITDTLVVLVTPFGGGDLSSVRLKYDSDQWRWVDGSGAT